VGTAITPGYGTLIGAILGAGAGLAGYMLQSSSEDEAAKILKQAQDKYKEVTAETIQKAAADVLGPTELAKIQADPGYQEAQDTALAELKRISDAGGMTLEDKAHFDAALARSGQQQAQMRRAALEGLRSRGVQGAGAETAMEIAGQQSAANAAAQAGVQALAESQRRALEAIGRRGELAGRMQQDKYQRAAQVAQAQDMINRMNWGNRQNMYERQMGLGRDVLGFGQGDAATAQRRGQQAAQMAENVLGSAGQFATGYDAQRMRAEERAADRASRQQPAAAPAVSSYSYGGLGADPFNVGSLRSPTEGLYASDSNKSDGE
jgi:hypothetical protein